MIQIEYLNLIISITIIVYLLYSLNKEFIKSIRVINYKISKYIIERKIASILKREDFKKYQQVLAENSFLKIRSNNKSVKIQGLQELAQLSDENDYNRLIIALKNEDDEQIQRYLINILYHIANK